MSKLKTIVLAALGALIVFVLGTFVLASTKPSDFRYERTLGINAQPEKIFTLVNDYHSWASWSPWEKLDPAMKKTFNGAASGVGSVYEWEGNSEVGKGRMEIIEANPPSNIKMRLDFLSPFEAHNTTEFSFTAKDGITHVTWAMYGPNAFFSKVMGLFCDMDQMIGKDFETGLNNIKKIVETK
ncbi:SRPBCC family protein [Leptospira santarosai]|uniref:Polyketide cyclase/dehydrase and lipid transport n=1 Tax=Leptospira santarosai str. CBC1416 TaxID=1193059 RepID=M6VQW7_9LEPT|nr:SRPBCC family protein [Leptospira santarosai]EMO59922.1 polyketide cyclase/dehydrase and lipid transport [Leptospira santarosai str. CBC1416]EMO31444.1 polyketide cyclase/dehydrase and lipid transport [Leptospira santarosai str. HAI821]EMP02222.1 polyketide cyclase/dehydrase and lipid transport [Leptospira santarosai str. HAI1380]EMP80505.1 polyketide cyclase/dehydrase and lipid transport [Leptospira santarosai str. CBC1531]MDI7183295.1 SRPBCC family protein [Leptospira santarosai]